MPERLTVIEKTAVSSHQIEDVKTFGICDDMWLCVKHGEVWLKLKESATQIVDVQLVEDTYWVMHRCSYCCDEDMRTAQWSKKALLARVENYTALQHHRQKRYAEAAAGFAAALQADPSFNTARTNLACALSRQGRTDEAVAVLLEDDGLPSIKNYLKILEDEDLAPLREHPAIVSGRSRDAGNITIPLVRDGLKDFGVAYAEEKRLIALISTKVSWSCDIHWDALDIFDADTGKRLTRIFLAAFDNDLAPQDKQSKEKRKAETSKRLQLISRFMNDLGFKIVDKKDIIAARVPGMLEPSRFSEYHMALLNTFKGVVVLKDKQQYWMFPGKTIDGYWEPDSAYIPSLDAFVIENHLSEPEDCLFEKEVNQSFVLPLKTGVPVPVVPNSNTGIARPGEKPGQRAIVKVFSGKSHHCVLRKNGNQHCFGQNENGEMGDETAFFYDEVRQHEADGRRLRVYNPVNMTDVKDAALGDGLTCSLKKDGTVWCWGTSHWGAVGKRPSGYEPAVSYDPVQIPELEDVIDIAGRGESFCAVKKDGTVWCWGEFIQILGTKEILIDPTPDKIEGLSNIRNIAMGSEVHQCAVDRGGRVLCWGKGRLGDGAKKRGNTPVSVKKIENAVLITAGRAHTCALDKGGEVWCWGSNLYGQVTGVPSRDRGCPTPVKVKGITEVVEIAAGADHTCALKKDGTVRCWGAGAFGQLGNDEPSNDAFPRQVTDLSNVISISAADRHTCAVKQDGTVWCWGENQRGSFLPGGEEEMRLPLRLPGLR